MGTEGRMRGTEEKNHPSHAEKIHGPITAILMSLREFPVVAEGI